MNVVPTFNDGINTLCSIRACLYTDSITRENVFFDLDRRKTETGHLPNPKPRWSDLRGDARGPKAALLWARGGVVESRRFSALNQVLDHSGIGV